MIMLGKNAIYLAKEIEKLNLYKQSKNDQIITIQNNKILFTAFEYALQDMDEVMCHFTGKHHNLNLYGFSIRFDGIYNIAHDLAFCAEKSDNWVEQWYDESPKNFKRIVEDLEEMVKRLDYDMTHNMTFVDGRDKNYNRMDLQTV